MKNVRSSQVDTSTLSKEIGIFIRERVSTLSSMNMSTISKDQIEEAVNRSLEIKIAEQAKQSEKMAAFYGSGEVDGEPDYEALRMHIEVWVQRHPEEMKEFLEYRNQTLAENRSDSGASNSLNMRNLGAMPPGLYALLCILSPNFLGATELKIEDRTKKQRTFYRKFPVFSMCKKI
jgi:hypothetical protein